MSGDWLCWIASRCEWASEGCVVCRVPRDELASHRGVKSPALHSGFLGLALDPQQPWAGWSAYWRWRCRCTWTLVGNMGSLGILWMFADCSTIFTSMFPERKLLYCWGIHGRARPRGTNQKWNQSARWDLLFLSKSLNIHRSSVVGLHFWVP